MLAIKNILNRVLNQADGLALDDREDRDVLERALVLAIHDHIYEEFSDTTNYVLKAQNETGEK